MWPQASEGDPTEPALQVDYIDPAMCNLAERWRSGCNLTSGNCGNQEFLPWLFSLKMMDWPKIWHSGLAILMGKMMINRKRLAGFPDISRQSHITDRSLSHEARQWIWLDLTYKWNYKMWCTLMYHIHNNIHKSVVALLQTVTKTYKRRNLMKPGVSWGRAAVYPQW